MAKQIGGDPRGTAQIHIKSGTENIHRAYDQQKQHHDEKPIAVAELAQMKSVTERAPKAPSALLTRSLRHGLSSPELQLPNDKSVAL